MEDLVKALTIFLKYGNPEYPTNCEHDKMVINYDINPNDVSIEDKLELDKLGFHVDEDEPCFYSYKFGSC